MAVVEVTLSFLPLFLHSSLGTLNDPHDFPSHQRRDVYLNVDGSSAS
jgi:hypothetical protein